MTRRQNPPTHASTTAPRRDTGLDGMPAGAGIPAATSFLAALSSRRVSLGQPLAIVVIHIDRYGHACDSLGAIRAARLRDHVQARAGTRLPPGAAAHWLSDVDLAIVTRFPAGIHGTARLGAELANLLGQPFVLDSFEIFLSFSIGVGEDSATLPAERSLQQACDAMLQVCRRGGNGMATTAAGTPPGTAPLMEALPHALERGELQVHLQPRAHFGTGTITSYTTRLRWQNPALGRVPPQDFAPAMEALGMMGDIARWLLRTMMPLMRGPGVDPALQLVIPAPSAQLHCTQMLDVLRYATDAFGVAADRLCIDVPVAAVPADGYIFSQFESLRQRGMRLSLSDFLDGPAGRSALARLAPDMVTLDVRALSQPHAGQAVPLLRSACEYALRAGATVSAKGVETRAQMAMVRDWGCDSMQGYLLSQSFPARWLAQTHAALAQRARDLVAELD